MKNAGQPVTRRQRHDLATPRVEEWIVLHQQCGDARFNQQRKSGVDLGICGRFLHDQLAAKQLGCAGYRPPKLIDRLGSETRIEQQPHKAR